jgi:group II intron reverse transcriptase/maturase
MSMSFNRGGWSWEEREMSKPRSKEKSFAIPRRLVWEAWRQVRANKGAPGVDEQSLEEFEAGLRDNLYVIWNRMSSGSYFPPPVRAVEIPKPHGGGTRMLGVPTVADRVAQTVAAMFVEALVEPRFHRDSYGYRPGRSAHDALAVCRRRCWEYDWAIDLDVQKFFDTVPWDLIVRAVEAVTDCRWVLLYVKRWLAAPLQRLDGTLVEREEGTPQGSAISPVLANLFLHYAFDTWMAREFPGCPFERYADDAIVHCTTRRQAELVLGRIVQRMAQVGLTVHPDKTRIVYCQDGKRRGGHEHTSFTFLGYTFRARKARAKNGSYFSSFLPAISDEALKAKSDRLRKMRIHRRTDLTLDDLADWLNPITAGWSGSSRGAVSALPPIRFPDPPAEPDVRIPAHPALHRTSAARFSALVRQRRFPAGWWLGLFRGPPTARACDARDSGSPGPRRASAAFCLRGWSIRVPSTVA